MSQMERKIELHGRRHRRSVVVLAISDIGDARPGDIWLLRAFLPIQFTRPFFAIERYSRSIGVLFTLDLNNDSNFIYAQRQQITLYTCVLSTIPS